VELLKPFAEHFDRGNARGLIAADLAWPVGRSGQDAGNTPDRAGERNCSCEAEKFSP
jgi:hypothetical protein